MKHKWTDDSGLPVEGTVNQIMLSSDRLHFELVEPVQFGWDGYNTVLKPGDIFYRYPLEPRSPYDESELWRVALKQNGVAYLVKFTGSVGAVFASRAWFQGYSEMTGKVTDWGYTLVGRHTRDAKPGSQIDRIHKWAKQYAGA